MGINSHTVQEKQHDSQVYHYQSKMTQMKSGLQTQKKNLGSLLSKIGNRKTKAI